MLSDIVRFLIDPFTVLVLLLCGGLIMMIRGRKKAGRKNAGKWLLMMAGVWFYMISTPFVPRLVTEGLENRYEPLLVRSEGAVEENRFAIDRERLRGADILVLGGGHSYDDRLPPNSLLSRQALMRLAEGIRLYRLVPESRLIFSGYSASGRKPQAEALAETAMVLGADLDDRSRYELLREPGNTWEESGAYIELRSEEGATDGPLIVVTSAVHMPRAVAMFKKRGFDEDLLFASPTDYYTKQDPEKGLLPGWRDFIPSPEPVILMKSSVKEWVARVQVWGLG